MSRATGQDATTGAVGVRVDRYAAARGEKAGTVRKRIQRGQLAGYKGADHRWYVVGEVARDATRDATGQDGTRDTRHDAAGAVAVNPNARAQLEAVRDEWLAPLVARITEQAERIGRLGAEREELRRRAEAAEAERDELRARLEAAQAAPADTGAPTVLIVEGDGHTHRPPLWQRLWRGLRGP
ncbi:MAG: hypothetical protein M3Q65_18610 [Chloroflexota bacterium]|nr:hypothetical protein [Chloroflexota bacterium]